MSGIFRMVLEALRRPASSGSSPASSLAGRRPALEALEDRTLLSAYGLPEGAVLSTAGCGCGCCPACGAYSAGATPQAENYIYSGYKWSQPGGVGSTITVTYSFDDSILNGSVMGVSGTTIKAILQEALGVWAGYAPINFVEVQDSGPNPGAGQEYNPSGQAMIRFGATYIDGSYGVLAYGYYPLNTSGLAGDVVFDTGENWATSPRGGVDMLEVAVHEIGHALGLNHSQISQAIMYASYSGHYSGLGTGFLYADDVSGIQAIYGVGSGSVTPLSGGGGGGSGPGGGGGSGPGGGGGSNGAFQLSGNTLYVYGTGGNDTFTFNVDNFSLVVSVNGQQYSASRSQVLNVVMDGGGGQDTAYFTGWSADESLWIAPGGAYMTDGFYTLSATGMEYITAATGGGIDAAYMFSSQGNDYFYAAPGVGYMLDWATYVNSVYGYTYIFGSGESGGIDQAYLYDSAGNDFYAVAPGQAYMSDGFSYLIGALAFPITGGIATAGGHDQATFYDSASDDSFVGTGQYSVMSGYTYYNLGFGFDLVTAIGSTGTNTRSLSGLAYEYDQLGTWA